MSSPLETTNTREALDEYHALRTREADDAEKLRQQPRFVSRYYDAVTHFYEFAWGTSFHFSARRKGETLKQSQARQEQGIGQLLKLAPGMKVLDVGCGIGGPLVEISRSTGAEVMGLNFNAYQISRGEELVREAGLEDRCSFLNANFMEVPLPDASFDAIYSFEAICHAPDTAALFRELYRLLKPGGEIGAVDWCLTEKFDDANAAHRDIRERLELGNSTPDLLTTQQQLDVIKETGFEVLSFTDQAVESDPETPWYLALSGGDLSLAGIARVPIGRKLTGFVTAVLEKLRIAPDGTGEASQLLNIAADSLVEAGEAGIFTPMFVVHARKPEQPVG